jgi:hypothetical protein
MVLLTNKLKTGMVYKLLKSMRINKMDKYYLTDQQIINNFITGYKKNLKQVIKENQAYGYFINDNYTYMFTPYLALKYEFNNSNVNDKNIKKFIKDVFNDKQGVYKGKNALTVNDEFYNGVKDFFNKDKKDKLKTVLHTTKNAVISNNKVLVKAITENEKIIAYIDHNLLVLPDNTRLINFTVERYLTDTIQTPLLYEDGSSFFSIIFAPVNYKN